MTHYPVSWPGPKEASTNHDPLCYMAEGKWGGGCQCDLIARARNDTLDKVHQSIKSLAGRDMAVVDATAWVMKSSALSVIEALRT